MLIRQGAEGNLEKPEKDKKGFHWKRQSSIGSNEYKNEKDEGTRRQCDPSGRDLKSLGVGEKKDLVASCHI